MTVPAIARPLCSPTGSTRQRWNIYGANYTQDSANLAHRKARRHAAAAFRWAMARFSLSSRVRAGGGQRGDVDPLAPAQTVERPVSQGGARPLLLLPPDPAGAAVDGVKVGAGPAFPRRRASASLDPRFGGWRRRIVGPALLRQPGRRVAGPWRVRSRQPFAVAIHAGQQILPRRSPFPGGEVGTLGGDPADPVRVALVPVGEVRRQRGPVGQRIGGWRRALGGVLLSII